MALVSLSHVSKHFRGPMILEDVTLEVNPGARIGVLGINGAGKSTLLKLLVGLETPTAGQVVRGRGVRLAYQAQELDAQPGSTVMQELQRVFQREQERDGRLRQLEHELAQATEQARQQRLLAEYQRLQDEHAAQGSRSGDQRIRAVLSGLGLPESAWEQPIASFSGGERNVIALARILLCEPDVILLDEPSNHLDLDGLDWFLRFMRSTASAVIMVSHDRYLLDACASEIWEVRRARVRTWAGNYTAFKKLQAEEQALQARRFKNQQRLLKRIEFQARRLKDMARAYDDAGQAKRAKAMLKRMEVMDKVERPEAESRSFSAQLHQGQRHGRIALSIKDYSFQYGERVLFAGASLEIEYGQRVCLLGPNGSGKSTLFKSILSEGSWENPILRLGRSVKLGRFHQFHEDVLDAEASLLDWLISVTGLTQRPAADLLHRFLFTHDDLQRPIGTLSGGEKSRLQLARLVQAEVNFLMLDEPTNHLDIQASEQLENMLREFDGTLFIISHDRRFLEKMVDVVVEVKERGLRRFQGSFEAWWERRAETGPSGRGAALTLHSQKSSAADSKQARQNLRDERKLRQREERLRRRRLQDLEQHIESLEQSQAELCQALERIYSGAGEQGDPAALNARLTEKGSTLQALYLEWEQVAADLEKEQQQQPTDE